VCVGDLAQQAEQAFANVESALREAVAIVGD